MEWGLARATRTYKGRKTGVTNESAKVASISTFFSKLKYFRHRTQFVDRLIYLRLNSSHLTFSCQLPKTGHVDLRLNIRNLKI